jgi:hypothetical protein
MATLRNIPVEILNTYNDNRGRCFARVMACKGEPFDNYSMGGNFKSAYRTVRIEYLKMEDKNE